MANTVHEPPQIDLVRLPDQGQRGNGGWKNLVPAGGRPLVAVEYSPPASSTAIWVVVFAVMMMFAAFTNPARWLYITLLLGLFFVAGQYAAWQQLRAQGIYLATNPSSSFFYLLTVVHAIHVLGGLGGLVYVIRKLRKSALRRSQLVATARYWHFMGILWVYLLSLLWMKV
jgi:heme/copper-type cytochrome/quinol oxidase subunit 3